MTAHNQRSDHEGWEHLFRSGKFPPRYQTFAEPNPSVVEWAATLPAGAFVLDLGCGVGRHTLYLGQQGFRVAGADISPQGVSQTQTICEQHQIPFEGRVTDMTQLPWDADMFDAVLSTSTICHQSFAAIQRTLAEVWRVLKPGGFLLVDFLHQGTRAYQEVLEQTKAGVLVEIEPNTFIDQSATPDLDDDAFIPHHYSKEAEVRDLLGSFERLMLWADLTAPGAGDDLPRRGYWVASARKPV